MRVRRMEVGNPRRTHACVPGILALPSQAEGEINPPTLRLFSIMSKSPHRKKISSRSQKFPGNFFFSVAQSPMLTLST